MLELAYIDSELLPGIGAAVREKTGETALILPELLEAAIKGIQTGVTLPELTTPAEESDVLEGKEYIGADGEKRTGTLVVCDTLGEVEHFGDAGIGLYLELESSADWSSTVMRLPEENLKSENIKSGIRIFSVEGSVKEIRTETGTITPAEDTVSLTIPEQRDGACALVVIADNQTALESKGANSNYSYRVVVAKAKNNTTDVIGTLIRYTGTSYSYAMTGMATSESGELYIAGSTGRYFRAGIVYRYYVYYWEDDA